MQKNRLSSVECDDNPIAPADLQANLSSKKSVKPNIIHRHSSSLYTKTSPSSSLSTSATSSNTPIALVSSNKSAVIASTGYTGQSPLKNDHQTQSTAAEILPQRLPLICSPQRSSQFNVKDLKNTVLLPNNRPQLFLDIQNKPQDYQDTPQKIPQTEMNSPNRRVTHSLKQDIINWVCGDSKLNFDQINQQQQQIEKNKNRNASVPIELAKNSTEPTISQARIPKNVLRQPHNEETVEMTASNSGRIRRPRRGFENESQDGGDKQKQLAQFAEQKNEKTETKESQSQTAFGSQEILNKKPVQFERLPNISKATKTSEKQPQFQQLMILNKSSLHSKISAVHDKITFEDNNNKNQIPQSYQPMSSSGQIDKEMTTKQEILGKFETSRIAKSIIKETNNERTNNTETTNSDVMKRIHLIGRRSSDGYQVMQSSLQTTLAENSTNTKPKEKANSMHVRNSSLQDEVINDGASPSSLHIPNQLLGDNGMRAELTKKRNYSSYSYLPLPAQIQSTQGLNVSTSSQSPVIIKNSPQFNYPAFKRIEKSSNLLPNDTLLSNPTNPSSSLNISNSNNNNHLNAFFNFQLPNSPSPNRKNREILPSIRLSDKLETSMNDPKDSLSPLKSLKKDTPGYLSPNKPIPLIPIIASSQLNTPEHQQSSEQDSSFSSATLLQSPHKLSSVRSILLQKFNKLETINQNNSQNLSSSSLSPYNNNNNNSNQSFQEILSDKFKHLKSIEKVINSNRSHLLNLQQITSVIGTSGQQQQQSRDPQSSILKHAPPAVFKNNSAINLGKQGYSACKIIGDSKESEIAPSRKNLSDKVAELKEKIAEEKMQEDEWNFDAIQDSPVMSNQSVLKSPKIMKSILKNSNNKPQLSESNSRSPHFPRSPKKVQFI